MIKDIDYIILDLGGVIINLNQELTQQAFQKLFGAKFEEILKKANQENVFENYETGHLTTAQFLAFFSQFNSRVTEKELLNAWNSMLLDIPKERIDLIEHLSKNYQMFLLSNTNEVHYNFIELYYQQTFKKGTFKSLFNKAFLSYEMGLRKPTIQIFEEVLKSENLNAKRTLFIDDSLEHVNAALSLGIKAHHLNLSTQTLNTFLDAN